MKTIEKFKLKLTKFAKDDNKSFENYFKKYKNNDNAIIAFAQFAEPEVFKEYSLFIPCNQTHLVIKHGRKENIFHKLKHNRNWDNNALLALLERGNTDEIQSVFSLHYNYMFFKEESVNCLFKRNITEELNCFIFGFWQQYNPICISNVKILLDNHRYNFIIKMIHKKIYFDEKIKNLLWEEAPSNIVIEYIYRYGKKQISPKDEAMIIKRNKIEEINAMIDLFSLCEESLLLLINQKLWSCLGKHFIIHDLVNNIQGLFIKNAPIAYIENCFNNNTYRLNLLLYNDGENELITRDNYVLLKLFIEDSSFRSSGNEYRFIFQEYQKIINEQKLSKLRLLFAKLKRTFKPRLLNLYLEKYAIKPETKLDLIKAGVFSEVKKLTSIKL